MYGWASSFCGEFVSTMFSGCRFYMILTYLKHVEDCSNLSCTSVWVHALIDVVENDLPGAKSRRLRVEETVIDWFGRAWHRQLATWCSPNHEYCGCISMMSELDGNQKQATHPPYCSRTSRSLRLSMAQHGSAWLSNLGSTGSCHRSLPRRELSRRATLIAERIQSGGPRQLGTMETWRQATGAEKCWETAHTYFCLLRLWSGVIKQPGFYTFLSVFPKIIASHTLVEHVWLHRRRQTYLEACTLVRRLVTQTNAVQKHPKALSGQEISISSSNKQSTTGRFSMLTGQLYHLFSIYRNPAHSHFEFLCDVWKFLLNLTDIFRNVLNSVLFGTSDFMDGQLEEAYG